MTTDPQNQNACDRADPAAEHETHIAELNTKAERCRRLAAGISDKQTSEVLRGMALNYEQSAARLSESG